MSEAIIDRIRRDLIKKGFEQRSAEARRWLMAKIRGMEWRVTPHQIMKNVKRHSHRILIGKPFFFIYDAKHKDTLPFWDAFPLTIPIEYYDDGFLGLNLHYLDWVVRAVLMDKLFTYKNNDKMDETTRMRLSYELISSFSRSALAKPCIKRYLYSHIDSSFVEISAQDWDTAMYLPVENFQKATKEHVWRDSKRKIRGTYSGNRK